MLKRIFIPIVLLLAIFLIGLPAIVSTKAAKPLVLSIVNRGISGEVSFDHLSLSWFGPSVIEQLHLNQRNGSTIVSVKSVTWDGPLWSYFDHYPPITVQQLNAHLEQYPNGVTNLEQALGSHNRIMDPSLGMPLVIDLLQVNAEFSNSQLKVDGKTKDGESQGEFHVEWDMGKDVPQVAVAINNLPTALLDQIIPADAKAFHRVLSAALGPSITITGSSSDNQVKLNAKGLHFSVNFDGRLEPELFTLTSPAELHLAVTPELLSYFTDKNLIQKPEKLVVGIDALKIPYGGNRQPPVIKAHLNQSSSATVLSNYLGDAQFELTTNEAKKPRLVVKSRLAALDAVVSIKSLTSEGKLLVKPATEIAFKAALVNQGIHLQLQGKEIEGSLQIQRDYDANADLHFHQFPIAEACEGFCPENGIGHAMNAALGKHIDGDITLRMKQWDGYLKGNLRGETGKISINSRLTHGVMTLAEPFQAELLVTPQLGKSVLQDIFPLLKGIVSSASPVQLHIPVEGTQIQLLPYHPQSANIGKSTLTLGTISFDADGEIGQILSLVNKTKQKLLKVQFTPLYFNAEAGKITLSRMDMLLMDEYPIATWGKVNIPKNKVGLVVGFTPRALERGLNLSGIPPNYMLQIEIKGTIDDPSFNQSKALAKISALIAASEGKQVGGSLLSAVLDIASGTLSDPAPPAPTTTPLPWSISGTKEASM